jgi:hypothetical protein
MLAALALSSCSDLKSTGGSSATDSGATVDAPTGVGQAVTVTVLADNRSRPGAFTSQGYRPFRTGIAVVGDDVFWVESGTKPGLYAVSATTSGDTVRTLASLTQPTTFASAGGSLYIADRTQLKQFTVANSSTKVLASVSSDIVTLGVDGSSVYFTEAMGGTINRTTSGSTTQFLNSNGAPVALALGASKLIWAGVDISGINGALQVIGTNKSGFAEYKRFSSGFATIAASDRYAYYAHESPPAIHRLTLSSGADERIAEGNSVVTEFALTETHAYWTERGSAPNYENGRIMRVAHDATTPEELAVSIPSPVAIAAVGNTAYVASAGQKSKSYANGSILRVTIAP